MMIAVDSETTGVDLHHGARPFLVTLCDEEGTNAWWEWDVDPLNREPQIPASDIGEIQYRLDTADELILQNPKFDASAWLTVGGDPWAWDITRCTLLAGHILGSNRPHTLDAMVVDYLGRNIRPLENKLREACNEARRLARQRFPDWMIAEEGLEGMPSAKTGSKKDEKGIESEKPWKFDAWLPRAIAKELDYPTSHPWWKVTSDYANHDSLTTIYLWQTMKALMLEQGLFEMYLERLKVLAPLHEMEQKATSIYKDRLEATRAEYVHESEQSRAVCLEIASNLGYELKLGKGNGITDSMRHFVFGKYDEASGTMEIEPALPLPVVRYTKTGNPSLNKEALDEYKKTLQKGTPAYNFVKHLSSSRKRDKSVEFFDAYAKYGVPGHGQMLLLHPSVNPTGTDTTRFSMHNPNLQQVSKQESVCEECQGEGCDECGHTGEDLHSARKIFGPGPGREWWSADASNIELRIPAFESKEPKLIELFERPNDPPFYGKQHLLNFSIVYDDIWQQELKAVGIEKVGLYCKKKYESTYYQWTKNGGLGMQYQSGRETADRTFRRAGSYDRLKKNFVELTALNDFWVEFAEKHGYVETIPDKTVCLSRGYPLLCSRGDSGRILSTVPLNYHTQGTAGWWMLKAINRCYAQLLEWREHGFDGFMCLTVHDEIVFDFPKRQHPRGDLEREKKGGVQFRTSNLWRIRKLQALMEQGGDDISIPTPVAVEYHEDNWAEGFNL